MIDTSEHCRCGHPTDSTEPHPCHWGDYTCREPATHFFYAQPGIGKFALAGAQMKVSANDSWACDTHRQLFLKELADVEALMDDYYKKNRENSKA